MKKTFGIALTAALALAGCPTEPANPSLDAGSDAPPTADTGPDLDAPPGDDAGGDDAGPVDGGPPPLPAITDPDPHTVAASADGHDRLYAVVFAPDSSFYVAGVTADGVAATDDFRTTVGHFTAAGDLDTAFGTAGWFEQNLSVGTNGELPRGIGLQSDGSIVVAATVDHAGATDARDRDVAVFRLTAAGVLDATFGTAGIALLDLSDGEAEPAPSTAYAADSSWNLVVDGSDRILVAVGMKRDGATDTDLGVVRLTEDGTLDATFGTAGVFSLDVANLGASVRSIALLPSGRILGSGYYRDTSMVVDPILYALTADGALDTSFATGGVFSSSVLAAQAEIYGIDLQGDSVVTGGYGRDDGPGDNDFITMRFDSTTGERDTTTYGTLNGVGILSGYDFGDNARAVVTLPDDRVLLVGALRTPTTATADAALVVFTEDGVPDATFGTGGVELADTAGLLVDHFWAVDVDPRGERVVAVGIGGTAVPTDDDGLVYLFPTP